MQRLLDVRPPVSSFRRSDKTSPVQMDANQEVKTILEDRGYDEYRPRAAFGWRPLAEMNGRYGTTDETKIEETGGEGERARLIDRGTGDVVAEARSRPADVDLGAVKEEIEDTQDRLQSYADRPNVNVATYLVILYGRDKPTIELEDIGLQRLVHSAGWAVLRAFDEGLDLSNLDDVKFQIQKKDGGHLVRIEVDGEHVTVPVTTWGTAPNIHYDGKLLFNQAQHWKDEPSD